MIPRAPKPQKTFAAILGPAVVLACAAFAGAALAFPDAPILGGTAAKVDAELKPRFGDLIFPPIRRHEPYRFERRGAYRPIGPPIYGYDGYEGYGGYGGYLPEAAPIDMTVDCSPDSPAGGPGSLSEAVYRIAPGGVIHIRQGSICRDSLYIEKSMTIVGEADSAFTGDGRRPRLEAQPGSPCIAVAPGANLEVRDLDMVDEQAGRNGCVEAQDAGVALTRVSIRYAGQRSAIDMAGGKLIVREARIDAKQADSAILADDTAIQIEGGEIRGQLAGLDLTPSLTAPSTIEGLRLIGPGDGDALEPRTVGVMVRGGQRASGQLTLHGVYIGRWRTGLWLDAGSRVELSDSRIHRAALGVLVDEAEGVIRNSAIGASEVGIYAGSGKLVVSENRIYGFRQFPIVLDRAVIASERADLVYPDGGTCRPFREWVPRCIPMNLLPYELTSEEVVHDWGVHGPIPYDTFAGPRAEVVVPGREVRAEERRDGAAVRAVPAARGAGPLPIGRGPDYLDPAAAARTGPPFDR